MPDPRPPHVASWPGRGSRGPSLPELGGVLLAVLVIASAIPLPFTGDQALFSLGARALADGRDLYTEFWDLKQPGIFWFFRLADVLPGGAEVRVHLLEVVWQLGACVVAVVALRDRMRNRWVLAAVPLLAVGWTYLIGSPIVMTQVEVLVGLPVLVALVAGARSIEGATAHRTAWAVGGGLAVLVLVALKLMLVVIPAGMWLTMWRRRRPDERGTTGRDLRLASATFLVPAAAYLAWSWSAGALGETLRTWFEVPLGAAERAGRPPSRLVDSVAEFARMTAPLVVLALVGIRRAVRRRDDAVLQGLVAWLVLGGVAFGLQLWWYYLAFVVSVPLGLLAAYGADDLLVRFERSRRAAAVAVLVVGALLAAPAAVHGVERLEHLVDADLALAAEDRDRFVAREDPGRVDVQRAADRLAQLSTHEDAVVVWGNPMILHLAGRQSAIAVHGWSPEHLDQRLWRRSAVEMHQEAPQIVFVDEFSEAYLATRGAPVQTVLADHYVEVAPTDEGRWYVLSGPMTHEPGEEHPADTYGSPRWRPVVSPGG